MFKKLSFLLLVVLYAKSFSQDKNLIGTWILDKVIYANGRDMEVNRELFSYELIYEISKNRITINDYLFDAVFSDGFIQTAVRKINYEIRSNYLLLKDTDDDKIYFFLKREDFIEKYPEFNPKEIIRNKDTLWLANEITKPIFASDQLRSSLQAKSMFRSSQNDDLYFKAE